MTRVVNLRREPYDVYIGRAGHGMDGYFGNPHKVGYCDQMTCHCNHTREEALAEYRKTFYYRIENDPQFFVRILELRDKVLGCFCKPLTCHGDVIKEFLDKFPSP
jgi:hypothetical protein